MCIEPEVRLDVGLLGGVPVQGGGGVDGRVVGLGIHLGRVSGVAGGGWTRAAPSMVAAVGAAVGADVLAGGGSVVEWSGHGRDWQ